ncbi:hypothetical protein K7X08_006681 [Anisodus acutangulus]|uniref:Uncharacterized protein n=1 Tax=Anisodus acutangulus TaxID=402998 RepID=A0A9Q1RRV0_9SOLA|nr:hypothetical protein K7X08_006681 [Anisodus acutangulus]
MLHLNTTAIHYHSTTEQLSGDQQCHSCGSLTTTTAPITAETPDPSPDKTTLLPPISTKAKRYSNCCFSSSLEEPFPKRTATLLPPISITTNGNNNNNNHFLGFTKIPLQESTQVTTPSPAKPPLPPPLYRTLSDPTSSSTYKRKSPTPPPHHTLTRTTKWSPNGESPTTMKSPNHCALTRTASWSPNVQELGGTVNNGESPKSPTAMRLKRMKDGMREMRQWCDLMIQEEDVQEATEPEINKILKDDETETGEEALCEEAVWVERMESCLILHFKCPCGKGYQILLCGNNCYYKLTNF